jgi:exodeoxyribonuclease VII large subunit
MDDNTARYADGSSALFGEETLNGASGDTLNDTLDGAFDKPRKLPRLARDTTAENPWPVSFLAQKYHDAVARWPGSWVAGQISEINTRRSGSAYLTLRDNDSEVSLSVTGFGMFAAAASAFRQGDKVVVYGRPDVWVKQTRLSFMGQEIRRVGRGGLMEQIEELRKRLKGEGLFDRENKVPLPAFPKRIGLICAPQARAEGDVKTNALLRWPTIEFSTKYVHVQGVNCPPEVIRAIAELDNDPSVDVIIVARGGGSFEDLIGFSDEGVVRATAACVTPIVSAIGHEDDWTLIDLAADMRASTPTDAAKRVVPDVMEELGLVADACDRMNFIVQGFINNETRLIEGYANRPSLTNPLTMLERPQRFIDDARTRLDIGLRRIIDDESLHIEKLQSGLRAMSPQATLDRGYALVLKADRTILMDAASTAHGDELSVRLKSGEIGVIVK